MPHLIIESPLTLSANVVKELHNTVGEQETVSIQAVKTRLYKPILSYSGASETEVHTAITLKLLSGRSPQQKEQMAENLFEKARKLIPEGTLSVEIVELGTYKK